MRSKELAWIAIVAATLVVPAARAQAARQVEAPQAKAQEQAPFPVAEIPDAVMTDGFLDAHPDLYHRRAGIERDATGDFAAARVHYERAAWYGDKPSQARLGEMYWNGQGVAPDRARGYLWMALAAQRGFREFVLLRQMYWQSLSSDEREEARRREQAMLAKYDDAVTSKHLARVMRRELRKGTGSLVAPSPDAQIYITRYEGSRPIGVDASRFYAREYWDPELYAQLRSTLWERQFEAKVEVGDLQPVPPADEQPPPAESPQTP